MKRKRFSAVSVRFNKSMSVCVPTMRRGRPLSLRSTTAPTDRIHFQPPSDILRRASTAQAARLPARQRLSWSSARWRSSGCKRACQVARVSLKLSGSNPSMRGYSGLTVITPDARSMSNKPCPEQALPGGLHRKPQARVGREQRRDRPEGHQVHEYRGDEHERPALVGLQPVELHDVVTGIERHDPVGEQYPQRPQHGIAQRHLQRTSLNIRSFLATHRKAPTWCHALTLAQRPRDAMTRPRDAMTALSIYDQIRTIATCRPARAGTADHPSRGSRRDSSCNAPSTTTVRTKPCSNAIHSISGTSVGKIRYPSCAPMPKKFACQAPKPVWA